MSTFHRLRSDVGESALRLFGYTCQQCGGADDLCVHHKVAMKPNNPKYNDIGNLTVLCRSCHMSYHRRSGDIAVSVNFAGRRGKGSKPVTCSWHDCDLLQHARGLCKKHYRLTFPSKHYSKSEIASGRRKASVQG